MYPQPEHGNANAWPSLHAEKLPDVENRGTGDYAILPRRKAGQSIPLGERAAVVLTKAVLEGYFGMPLSKAAKELVRFNPPNPVLLKWSLTLCVPS
jgi:hypothetical protein